MQGKTIDRLTIRSVGTGNTERHTHGEQCTLWTSRSHGVAAVYVHKPSPLSSVCGDACAAPYGSLSCSWGSRLQMHVHPEA